MALLRPTPAVTACCRPLVVAVVMLPTEPQGLVAGFVAGVVFEVVFMRALESFEKKAIDLDTALVVVFILTGQAVTLMKGISVMETVFSISDCNIGVSD